MSFFLIHYTISTIKSKFKNKNKLKETNASPMNTDKRTERLTPVARQLPQKLIHPAIQKSRLMLRLKPAPANMVSEAAPDVSWFV